MRFQDGHVAFIKERRRPEPEEPVFRYDPDKPLTLKADSLG
jgi:hypothetical protein